MARSRRLSKSQAEDILREVPKGAGARGRCLEADAIARRRPLRSNGIEPDTRIFRWPSRSETDTSGVMVANGALIIADTACVASSRLAGLLAHEVGTHILTYVNGSLQHLKLLASGLAGYEETQEGLALIAEAAVGGLTAGRLRQIAARVIAVSRLLQGSLLCPNPSRIDRASMDIQRAAPSRL